MLAFLGFLWFRVQGLQGFGDWDEVSGLEVSIV